MSKELIKELIAGAVDGDYHSFASATGKLVEDKMKGPLSEAVADIKASLFEKKHKKEKDDLYKDDDYGIGDKMDVEEGNTEADQNFNNDQQQQALSHVGQITFAESDETGGPAAAKKRVKNSSVDVSLGKAGPDETSSSDQKAKFNSDSEDPESEISAKQKKNQGSVKIKAAGKDTAGTDVISDSVVKGSETAVNPEDDTYDDSGYDVHEDDEDKYEDDDDDDDKKSRSAKEVEKDADEEEEEESEDKVARKEKMKDKMRYSDDEKEKDQEEAAEYDEMSDADYEDMQDYEDEEDEEGKDESQDYGPDSTSDSRRKSRERESNAAKLHSDNKRSRDMMKHHPKPGAWKGE